MKHEVTKESLNKITAGVRRIAQAYKAYQEGMNLGEDQAMYSAQHLQKLADQKLEALVEAARNQEDNFTKEIEKAQKAELENARVLDMADPRIPGTLDTIKNVKITPRLLEVIVSAFIGEAAALDLLREALNTKGVEIPDYMKPWFFNPENLFDKLDEALAALVVDPRNISSYFAAVDQIERIGKVLGIDQVDLNVGLDRGEYVEQSLRSVMGI